MLALIVVAIMLGFPTAFTLMGMGVFFGWLAYRSVNPAIANQQVLDLMVQRAYSVMSNDVLIAIPLFVFMGYLVERANLIEKLFKSLHLALARVPGALAVATIVTCAIFATATGIVGAVVTLMGLLALPAMLRAGYSVQLSAGAITAGGCLGILIPPSVLLIVYGATAGVSVVKLYAGAFFPGIMLAGLYVVYVIVVAKLKPHLAPPLSEERAQVRCRRSSQALSTARPQRARRPVRRRCAPRACRGARSPASSSSRCCRRSRSPPCSSLMYGGRRRRRWPIDTTGLVQVGGESAPRSRSAREPASRSRRSKALRTGTAAEPGAAGAASRAAAARRSAAGAAARRSARRRRDRATAPAASGCRRRPGSGSRFAVGVARAGSDQLADELAAARDLQDAADVVLPARDHDPRGAGLDRLRPGDADRGGGGRRVRRLAARWRLPLHRRRQATRRSDRADARDLGGIVKESSFLTAKTSAMVCWLFVGSSIFSASFALLGGQELVERWVLSLGLTTDPVHDAGAVHHLHPRLAARVDRDHRHLHADLHSAAAASSTSTRCSSACWWR